MNDDSESEVEECPICARCNLPGEDDTCEHFIGAVWDGELMWGQWERQPGHDFQKALAEVQELWREASPKRRRGWVALLDSIALQRRLLDDEASATEVLENWGDYDEGPPVETDGMMSGAGHSLYHRDAKILQSLTERLRQLGERLRSR
jgi:hypothetical protein